MRIGRNYVRTLALWTAGFALATGALVALHFPTPAAGEPANGLADPHIAAVQAAAAVPARSLTGQGIDAALGGQFQQARADLTKAAKAHGNDTTAREALKILDGQMARFARAETRRKKELAGAIARVDEFMLAQSYADKLAKSGLGQKVRDKVQAAITAYNDSGDSQSLDNADTASATKLRAQIQSSIRRTVTSVDQAVGILRGDRSPYADRFRALGTRFDTRARGYLAAWKAANLKTQGARQQIEQKLSDLQDNLTEALADVEGMAMQHPWRDALLYARVAAQIAIPSDHITDQKWYKSVVAEAEARAKAAEAQARWFDSLSAYAGLHDLDHDNEFYSHQLKIVERHVRALGLYGPKGAATQPAPTSGLKGKVTPPPTTIEAEPTWKELVAGVDADMVEKAIVELDTYYVSAVDYRKVTRGALESVKVLAETPQAAYSFPDLGKPALRKAFIEAIDGQLETVQKRDRVDQLDLELALNSVLRASERTVHIPTDVLAVEFTDGFIDELDRFSAMIWPYDVSEFNKETMGHFCGIGVQITKDFGEPLKVVTPLPDSPALRAGIKSGDWILAVDGRATQDLSVDKLIRLISGPKGTKVVLRIRRPGMLKPQNVSIVRQEITIRTVKGWRRLPGGGWDYLIDPKDKIGYIRLSQFTEQSPQDIMAALADLHKEGAKSLILDLRFNPGGLLRSATQIADQFLRSGRIVSTRGRQSQQVEFNAHDSGEFLTGNMVTLVNQHSASAAEILSGALKDWRRSIIVGERSFGKGSVQNVLPIPNHRAFLKLTTAYYYLPSGRLLHRMPGSKDWGVDPNVVIPASPRQMRRCLELRRKADLLSNFSSALVTGDLKQDFDDDMQLNTAVALLRLEALENHKPAAAP